MSAPQWEWCLTCVQHIPGLTGDGVSAVGTQPVRHIRGLPQPLLRVRAASGVHQDGLVVADGHGSTNLHQRKRHRKEKRKQGGERRKKKNRKVQNACHDN